MSRNYPPRDDSGQPIHDYKEIQLEFAQMKLDARKRKERKHITVPPEIDCQHKGAACQFPNCHCEINSNQK